MIAGVLNRNGLTTGNSNRWTRERVTALRSYRKIPVFRPRIDGVEPWLNLGGAAKLLGITPKTLRLAAEAGEIEATHPLPDGPWMFSRSKLATSQTRQILDRVRLNPRHPTGSHPDQKNLYPPLPAPNGALARAQKYSGLAGGGKGGAGRGKSSKGLEVAQTLLVAMRR